MDLAPSVSTERAYFDWDDDGSNDALSANNLLRETSNDEEDALLDCMAKNVMKCILHFQEEQETRGGDEVAI